MRAFITGIGGQDGSYLAHFLLGKGYKVCGTSRSNTIDTLVNLKRLGIDDIVKVVKVYIGSFNETLSIISDFNPSEIYHLAAQSSVGLSFEMPFQTVGSIVYPTLNILETIKFLTSQ